MLFDHSSWSHDYKAKVWLTVVFITFLKVWFKSKILNQSTFFFFCPINDVFLGIPFFVSRFTRENLTLFYRSNWVLPSQSSHSTTFGSDFLGFRSILLFVVAFRLIV